MLRQWAHDMRCVRRERPAGGRRNLTGGSNEARQTRNKCSSVIAALSRGAIEPGLSIDRLALFGGDMSPRSRGVLIKTLVRLLWRCWSTRVGLLLEEPISAPQQPRSRASRQQLTLSLDAPASFFIKTMTIDAYRTAG